MKLLLDEGMSYRAAALLRERGLDAIHTFDRVLAATSDDLLVRLARKEGRVIVTLDSDFHALLARDRATSPSVIRIRFDVPDFREQAALVEQTCNRYRDALIAGAAVSVSLSTARVRELPLP